MQPNNPQQPQNPAAFQQGAATMMPPQAPQSFQMTAPAPATPAPAAQPDPSQTPAQAAAPAQNDQGQAAQPNKITARASRKDTPTSSQHALVFSELRDSMVIMKDGSFRAVVACKSINFDLMSDAERDSIEYSYQQFLNSLDFTIQILVRSQRVDIAPYLDKLADLRRNNDNMLLGVLMDDYIEFISALSEEVNIMDKSFFIVIPYYISKDAEKALEQSKNFFKTFTKDKTPPITRIDRATYDKAVTEIKNRVETVISGLNQVGVRSVRLNTTELAQLYYNFNNPDTAIHEPLGDFNNIAQMYVRKAEPGEEL